MALSVDEEVRLAELVKNYPCLYDKFDMNFRVEEETEKCWDSIAKQLTFIKNGDDASKLFFMLKKRYLKKRNVFKKSIFLGKKPRAVAKARGDLDQYMFMAWIDPYLRLRRCKGEFRTAHAQTGLKKDESLREVESVEEEPIQQKICLTKESSQEKTYSMATISPRENSIRSPKYLQSNENIQTSSSNVNSKAYESGSTSYDGSDYYGHVHMQSAVDYIHKTNRWSSDNCLENRWKKQFDAQGNPIVTCLPDDNDVTDEMEHSKNHENIEIPSEEMMSSSNKPVVGHTSASHHSKITSVRYPVSTAQRDTEIVSYKKRNVESDRLSEDNLQLLFAKSVAAELSALPGYERCMAQHDINQVLFKYKMMVLEKSNNK